MVDAPSDPPHRAAEPPRLAGALGALEHASLWIERPVRRVAGSNRLNPLPYAGTITVFLLAVVVMTGLYITLFFEFGHQASYDSVASIEANAIQRIMRAAHRYASAAMVLTTLIHGWRIFAAGRYTGRPRRWRWATGVAALLLVWLAGVTGYWLVWDVRAQALSEATIALIGGTAWGADLAINQLSGIGSGSGSGFLLILWFLHLGLTGAIAWFTFRHLRRSKLAWLPPRHWMILMGGSLLFVSLAFPVGMLERADPTRLLPDMPLDPFVLFLLPPLLSDARWLAIALGIMAIALFTFLPRLLRSADPDPVVITAESCTGCDLCVADCPYEALTMVERADHQPSLAVVDSSACVACGICLGSCAFGAIELPGWEPVTPTDVSGRRVVVACDRHVTQSNIAAPGDALVPVRCAGMFAATGVRGFMDQGATGVQLVGCPPNDCRYGIGNQLASERILGIRAPHTARRWSADISQDWVAPTELASALSHPGTHPSADGTKPTVKREAFAGASLLVALSVVGVVLATRAPFSGATEQSQVRVTVDHVAGQDLQGVTGPSPLRLDKIEVRVNGASLGSKSLATGADRSLGILDWPVAAGPNDIRVVALSDGSEAQVFSGEVRLEPGTRLVVEIGDTPLPPGAEEGRKVFNARASGCAVCHSVEQGVDGVGPSLAGIGSVGGERVPGLSTADYLRQSIFLPDQYIVPGWPAGQMLPIYRDELSDEELDALIAYLLTLTEEASG